MREVVCPSCGQMQLIEEYQYKQGEFQCNNCPTLVSLIPKSAIKPELTEFTKHDEEKIRMELTDPAFNELVAKVLTYGANKYSADNWKKLTDKNRAIGALLRHITAYQKGELIDPESKLPHLGHAACNLMFLNYIDENKPKEKPNV